MGPINPVAPNSWHWPHTVSLKGRPMMTWRRIPAWFYSEANWGNVDMEGSSQGTGYSGAMALVLCLQG